MKIKLKLLFLMFLLGGRYCFANKESAFSFNKKNSFLVVATLGTIFFNCPHLIPFIIIAPTFFTPKNGKN